MLFKLRFHGGGKLLLSRPSLSAYARSGPMWWGPLCILWGFFLKEIRTVDFDLGIGFV